MDQNAITYFAETDARNKKVKFGIKAKDRLKHVYIIGKTGMGKSTLLENMAVQDIQGTEGMAFMDPHGGTAEKLLDYVPAHRVNDVIYFAPFDTENPISFNLLEDIGENKRHLVVNGLMATFEKIWADAWSARMAYILSNTLYALLETPGSTLLGVNRMYSDKDYRKMVVDNIKNVSVKNFWTDEYAKYSEKFATEATAAIQNKIGQFTSNSLVRNIIGQSKSTFDIRKIMDDGKIMIVNLSKGQVGDGNANLLGSMLITKIYLAALSRADLSEAELNKVPSFYLYVDEFQSFANKSFANILSEARKYKLNLTIAHQYIEQMEEEVRDAVFGNVGTMITFRVGAFDAEVLEKEFAPVFTAEDLVNLGFTQIYLKLMINGVSSQPFSATTMGPIQKPEISVREEVIAASRKNYARTKAQVEEEITHFHEPSMSGPTPAPNQYQNNNNRNQNYGQNQGQGQNQNYNQNRSNGQNFSGPRLAPAVALPTPMGPERELPSGFVTQNQNQNQNHNRPTGPAMGPAGVAGSVAGSAAGPIGNTSSSSQMQQRDYRNDERPHPPQDSSQNNKMVFAAAAEQLKKMETVAPQKPVSLADLKPEHEKAKIPTKENVGSLKDALSAVLAQKPKTLDVVATPKPKPVAPVVQVAPVDTPKPVVQADAPKPVQASTSAPTQQPKVEKTENAVHQQTEAKQQTYSNTNTNTNTNTNFNTEQKIPRYDPVREVPEDVLRNLLSLDEPVVKG